MTTAEVVERLDPLEDDSAGVIAIFEVMAVDEFHFQGGEERLRPSIIIAIAATTHGGSDPVSFELGAEAFVRVLDAAIGVEEQARGTAAAPSTDGHLQGSDHEIGFERAGKGPAQHPLAIGVDNDG